MTSNRGNTSEELYTAAAARDKRNAERMNRTASVVAHPATSAAGVIVLSHQCHAEVARLTGTRYAPVLGGSGTDNLGWQRLGYCYKQAPDVPIADDGSGTPGAKRPFEQAWSDIKADSDAAMRQLRAEIAEMRELEALAKVNRRRERDLNARAAAFEERHRRPWRYIAKSYFPDDFGSEDE